MKNEKPVINFQQLIIDKENDYVRYNDELHKYWSKEGEQECISVTTLIHKFSTFDEEFWSSYKALEGLLTEEQFVAIKPTLLDTKVFKPEYYKVYNITEKEFELARFNLLEEWRVKREESCIRGTEIHRQHELLHLGGKTKELKQLGLDSSSFEPNVSNKIRYGEKGVYPELLLSRISPDGELRIAGQADLVIVDGEDVYILDYKTNKEIKKKSFFDVKKKKSTRMKYPLNKFDDTNFWHYTLQLSTYAWMIEKLDPRFNIKLLMLIHYDHDGGVAEYECEYLKDDVERMLAYHKKQIKHENFKKSRQKIVF